MIDLADVVRLEQWIASGKTPLEIEQRIEVTNALLFEGKSADEVQQVKALVDEAKRKIETAEVPPRYFGLVTPSRPGYRRAQREETMGAQAVEMRARSKGSPFEATNPPAAPKSAMSKLALANELAKIGK